MIEGIAVAILAGFCWSLLGVIFSQASRRNLDPIGLLAMGSVFLTLLSLLLPDYDALSSGQATRVWELTLIIGGGGMAIGGGMLLLQVAMKLGHHAASWTINQSAMIIPVVVGVLFLGDTIGWFRGVGLACVLTSVLAFGLARHEAGDAETPTARFHWKWLGVALLVPLMVGTQQVLSMIPSYWSNWQDVARLRVPLTMVGTLLVYWPAVAIRRRWPSRRSLLPAMLLTAIGLPGQAMAFWSLDRLANYDMAGYFFPLAIGTCTLSFVLYSILVIREHTTRWHLAGLVLGVAGLLVLSLPGKIMPG